MINLWVKTDFILLCLQDENFILKFITFLETFSIAEYLLHSFFAHQY